MMITEINYYEHSSKSTTNSSISHKKADLASEKENQCPDYIYVDCMLNAESSRRKKDLL